MPLSVVILAAGQGKRMCSDRPKVLHSIGGKSMLGHVLHTVEKLQADHCIVVYGHGGSQVLDAFPDHSQWVEQINPCGTGDAVIQALPLLKQNLSQNLGHTVLVLYGDVPLLRAETLEPLLSHANKGDLAVLTAKLDNPHGYGRILRDSANQVKRIVEEKDAKPEEKKIKEINTGILAAPGDKLQGWLSRLGNNNAQGEYYLTDIIEFAVQDGLTVQTHTATDPLEIQGINDRQQQATVERYYQSRLANDLLVRGVSLADPARIDIRGTLTTGRDVNIDINVVFEGDVTLGDRVRIEPNCIIRNSDIGPDCTIHANSVLDGVVMAEEVNVGPFARLRPSTQLAAKSRIGNFVETKNAQIGSGSKANHLSYIGDAEVGQAVNIGAGTITCNYDGANKHKTVLEDDVFIGSNSALVAPIRIGQGATVGAGSTLNKDVPAKHLALSRSAAKEIPWQRPQKK